MEQTEEQLSPEEKLLKVIQGGEESEEESAAPGAGDAPSAEGTAADGAGAAAAPRLKLADSEDAETPGDTEPGVEDTAPPAAEQEEAPEGADELIGTAPLVAGKRKPPSKAGMRTVNKCLLAVVIVLLALSCWEIWSGVSARADTLPIGPEAVDFGPAGRFALVPVEALLEEFATRSMWDMGEEKGKKPVVIVQTGPAPVADGALKLIGLSAAPGSDVEAIIFDNMQAVMNFVTVGQKFLFNDRELQVEEILSDRVVLLDGEKRLTLQ